MSLLLVNKKKLFYILGFRTSLTYRYFVSGYTNKATTLEIRKFSDKLNYLNFAVIKFSNMCRADDFVVNYTFLHHTEPCVFESQKKYLLLSVRNKFLHCYLTPHFGKERVLVLGKHTAVSPVREPQKSSLFKLCHIEYDVQFYNTGGRVMCVVLTKCQGSM